MYLLNATAESLTQKRILQAHYNALLKKKTVVATNYHWQITSTNQTCLHLQACKRLEVKVYISVYV